MSRVRAVMETALRVDRQDPFFHVAWHGPLGALAFGWMAYVAQSLAAAALATMYVLVTAAAFLCSVIRSNR